MKAKSNASFARLLAGKALAFLVTVVAAAGLVLGFWQPTTAKAETLSYDYVDEAETGESYLIVSNGQALVNNNGSVGTVAVTVSGNTVTVDGDTVNVSSMLWTVGDDGSLKNDSMDADYYVKRASGSGSRSLTLNTETSSGYTGWTYTGEQLTMVGGNGSTYYIYYNDGWYTNSSTSYTAKLYGFDDGTPKVSVSPKTLNLNVGDSSVLSATIKNADGAVVEWSSSNETAATVNDGTVYGVATGDAIITASITVDEVVYSASCNVSVTTVTTYQLVNSAVAGKEYLIVSANSESGYALVNNNGSASSASVTINAADDNHNAAYITLNNDNAVWTAGTSDNATYTTTFTNNDYKLCRSSSSVSLSKTSDSNYWTASDGTIWHKGNRSYYYLRYSSGWSFKSSNSASTKYNAYLFEKVDEAPQPTKYTVTFVDEEGTTVLLSKDYAAGTAGTDIEVPADPTKQNTDQYTYAFVGWNDGTTTYAKDQLPTVSGNVTYTATFSETVNQYTVTFVDEDGATVLKEETAYDYGTPAADIVLPDETPTKTSTAQYDYAFAGWEPELAVVTADATYKATYTSNLRSYTVTFLNWDESQISTGTYDYGTSAAEITPNDPTRADEGGMSYAFAGWSDGTTTYASTDLPQVTADVIYTAVFDETELPELGAVVTTTPVALGSTATFACEVTGAEADACTYQWQYRANGGKWVNATGEGADAATYSVKASSRRVGRGQEYRCVVSASGDRIARTEAVGFAAFTLSARTEAVGLGEVATFTCEVTGIEADSCSYQWQYRQNGGGWARATGAGADTATYSVRASALRVGRSQEYRCVVTTEGGVAYTEAVGFSILK